MVRAILSLSLLLSLCFFLTPSLAQQSSRRLNDGWQFLKGDVGGVWEILRKASPGSPESVPLWEDVALPHCFNAMDAVDPDVNYYQGPGWYRSNLEIDKSFRGRVLLHFEGAGQKTEVYIGMEKVGGHTGGYDEWTVDITDAVTAYSKTPEFAEGKKIPLSIRCDNSRDLEMIPSDMSDFNVYGGMYRYLNLNHVPDLSIAQAHVSAAVDSKGKSGSVGIRLKLYNPKKIREGKVIYQAVDAAGNVVLGGEKAVSIGNDEIVLDHAVIKKPALWSPDQPHLYTFRATIVSAAGEHQVEEKFGFRHFEFVKNGPFLLNGERLLIRGTHRHEDHAGVAAAMTESMIRDEMKLIKEMGANFIRLGHYQQSRIVLDLCDSLGIMVWEEIPWCRGGLGGEVYREQARRMLTNMIGQHYNHPSVIIWGLGNENDWPGDFPEFDKEKIRAFMSELNELSHQLDPSRTTGIRRCDFCKDIVDVYSPSIWAGWYRGIYTEYQSSSRKEMERVNHFFHMEWGGDSHAGRHAEYPFDGVQKIQQGQGTDERTGDAALTGGSARVSKDGDWSETYICNLFDWTLKEQEKMDWLTGAAFWIFKDFSTPLRPENPVPYVNQKGVVERDLTKKESYYVFQSYWAKEPMLRIYGHSWPVRWGDKGEKKTLKVYSNCDEVELFLNGQSLGKKKRNSQDYPAAGFHWETAFQEGRNIVKAIGYAGKRRLEDAVEFVYQTEKWGQPYQLSIDKVEYAQDTATVWVKVLDDQGIHCLDADEIVSYTLSGDGDLLVNLGTSSGSKKVQLFNGTGKTSIKLNGSESWLSAACEGMQPVFVNVSPQAQSRVDRDHK